MTDIAELMARDPLSLTKDDYDAIILRLRQARSQYSLGAKSAGNPKKTTKAAPSAKPTLDLAALGLIPPTSGETK